MQGDLPFTDSGVSMATLAFAALVIVGVVSWVSGRRKDPPTEDE